MFFLFLLLSSTRDYLPRALVSFLLNETTFMMRVIVGRLHVLSPLVFSLADHMFHLGSNPLRTFLSPRLSCHAASLCDTGVPRVSQPSPYTITDPKASTPRSAVLGRIPVSLSFSTVVYSLSLVADKKLLDI